MEKTVKLDGKEIPCKDVIRIQPVFVSDTRYCEITYDDFEPCYHRVVTLVAPNKGYEIEKKVRKAMNKR